MPWRPAYEQSRHAKPTAPGVQPALVVGPPGEEVHTDALGRIQVCFPWDPEGRDSCWLRVLTPVAGEGWGQLHLPRVGQEVLVGYIGNDIDRPVVLGCLGNGTHPPPRFSGAAHYPANRALSGFQSRELRGTGYGELLFDDSTGQIKTKLSSEYGKTQLNLGWIGGPRYDGASVYRGAGFELRSDLFGALRAAKGLLISADPRPEGKDGTLDRQELLGQLDVTLGHEPPTRRDWRRPIRPAAPTPAAKPRCATPWVDGATTSSRRRPPSPCRRRPASRCPARAACRLHRGATWISPRCRTPI